MESTQRVYQAASPGGREPHVQTLSFILRALIEGPKDFLWAMRYHGFTSDEKYAAAEYLADGFMEARQSSDRILSRLWLEESKFFERYGIDDINAERLPNEALKETARGIALKQQERKNQLKTGELRRLGMGGLAVILERYPDIYADLCGRVKL